MFFYSFMPNKLRKLVVMKQVENMIFKDPQEQKRFTTPLNSVQENNGKGKKSK